MSISFVWPVACYALKKDPTFFAFWWLWFYAPSENFSLIWRRHHYQWRASNFDLCHTWFTRGIRLEWSSQSLRTRETHTYCRTFWGGAVTTWFYELGLSRLGFGTPTSRLLGESSNRIGTWSFNWTNLNFFYIHKDVCILGRIGPKVQIFPDLEKLRERTYPWWVMLP